MHLKLQQRYNICDNTKQVFICLPIYVDESEIVGKFYENKKLNDRFDCVLPNVWLMQQNKPKQFSNCMLHNRLKSNAVKCWMFPFYVDITRGIIRQMYPNLFTWKSVCRTLTGQWIENTFNVHIYWVIYKNPIRIIISNYLMVI